ncbi:MAG: DUF3810 domain-containing protein [Eubacteriales bacterium]|nr:DUF3810 domain-containing protein [Eubacteriales bacterium]
MQKQKQKKRLSPEWRFVLLRLPWLLLIPLAMCLAHVASRNPQYIEDIYAKSIYPVINQIVGTIFSFAPFSVVELVLYGLIIGLALFVIVSVVRMITGSMPVHRFVNKLVSLGIAFGVLFNLFYFSWGFNYFRPSIANAMELNVHERSQRELETLCYSLAEAANDLRTQVNEDSTGVFTLPAGTTLADCFQKAADSYTALGKEYPMFTYAPAKAKYVLASEAMSWAGISGIFVPFTAESNLNVHQPLLMIPVSAAHENAHACGIAPENEANFVGFLACMYSSDTTLQYSGVMLALINSGNALHDSDEAAYDRLFATYSEGVVRDIKHYNAYWKAYEGPVEEAMTEMNDNYLKYNRQESGVKSYGEMVDLLLAWLEKESAS